eukprot:Hpha_TRINITY_DN26008_c0_g1::TRINITY_DN26008_c0_g1_i1::g.115177::m.115177
MFGGFLLPLVIVGQPSPAPYIIDVANKYGEVSYDTLVQATKDGAAALELHDSVTVKIAAGRFVLDLTGDLFTVDDVVAKGEFAVEGAGMNETVLVLNQGMNNMIKGKNFKNVAWRDLTFTHTTGQTTQGKVVDVADSTVTLEVPAGFPTPADILQERYPRLRPSQGLYLLQFSTAPPGSVLRPVKLSDHMGTLNYTVRGSLPTFNPHLGYECSANPDPPMNGSGYSCDAVRSLGGNKWQFTPRASEWGALREFYRAAMGNDSIVVGIKAKRGGQAYALKNGEGVVFERVSWQGHSRGIVQDTDNVLFKDTDVSPMPPPVPGVGYAVGSNGGGPQIHGAVHNIRVEGHRSQSSGDDSLAFFDIVSGAVTGCEINDGWGAGILLNNVSAKFDRGVQGNIVRRTPIYYPDAK